MSALFAGLPVTPRQILGASSTIREIFDVKTCGMLVDAATYISQVLTKPDPMLGRPGAVCPFVGAALLDNMITLSVLPMRAPDEELLSRAALAVGAEFLPMPGSSLSRGEALRASIILLPNLDAEEAAPLIETVQKVLKPDMVRSGLMIGEFFPGCTAPGLNNPDFQPANTAFAFLAIRRMAAADLPFLLDDAVLLDSYLARFGDEGRRRLDKLRPALNTGSGAVELAVVARSALGGGIDQIAHLAG